MSFNDLLKSCKAGDNQCTHTRIGDISLNIYPGKYNFGEKENEFYEKIYKDVIVNLKHEYLTEKQRTDGTLVVDFDFRYDTTVTTRQHTADDIENIVLVFLEEIKSIVHVDQPFSIYVMEKSKVNKLPEKTKDGIHFVFTFDMPRECHKELRKRVIDKLKKDKSIQLPLINSWDNVYDDSISNGTNNWMIYGCRKPAHEAYDITHIYYCELDTADNEFMIEKQKVDTLISFETFYGLSVRKPKHFFNSQLKANNAKTDLKQTKSCCNIKTDDKYVDLLFNVIGNGDYICFKKWFQIASILKSNGYSLEIFEKYTNLHDPDNPKTPIIWSSISKQFSIFGLQNIAKEVNPELYKKWLTKHNDVDAIICPDEKTASEYIFNLVKDELVSYKGRLFYKKDNIWLNDEKKIDDAMLLFIMSSNIYTGTSEKKVAFAQNVTKARKIQEALFCKIRIENEDNQIYDKFHLTTKGGVCFNDGFLDFKSSKFLVWSELPPNQIYSTVRIERNFKNYFENPDLSIVNDLKTKIFEPLYGKNMDTALHFLSRAIAGNIEDKRWATYLGNRDCGKGVEYSILSSAFGPYVSQFELGNILYTRYTSGFENLESSRKLYWLLDYEHVRLAVSQEIPNPNKGDKANSKILKKMTGGGDTFVAKRNYDRKDTYFTIDTTFYIKGNNSLVCDTDDCLETCIEFSSFVQFKSQEEINFMRESGCDDVTLSKYRIADPNIKLKCMSDEWANAMVYLLMQNYKDCAVPIKKEFDLEENFYINAILRDNIITYNVKDHIPCNAIYDLVKDCDKAKLALELSSLNIHKKKCGNRSCVCYNKWSFFGLKPKLS